MAYRIAAEVAAREDEWLAGGRSDLHEEENRASKKKEGKKDLRINGKEMDRDAVLMKGFGIGGIGGAVDGRDEEETREAVFYKLDGLGYRVGLGLVERSVLFVWSFEYWCFWMRTDVKRTVWHAHNRLLGQNNSPVEAR